MDASGQLTDGTKINGVVDLRNALLRYSPQFVRTVTEKLLTYALGRGVEYQDMPVVRAIVRDAARNDYRFSSLIDGHREERAVSDESKPGSRRQNAAHAERSSALGEAALDMFITRKHIPRRTHAAGAGRLARAAVARFDGTGAAASGQGSGAPKVPRFVGIFSPHGWAPDYWSFRRRLARSPSFRSF